MATLGSISSMFHGRLRIMGVQSYFEQTPFLLAPIDVACPLVQLPHRSKGTGPHYYCSSSLWSPMGRTPSPIPIGQPSGSSVSWHTYSGVYFFFSASWLFTLSAKHIPEIQNSATDAISRDRASALPLLFPHANPTPSPIPSTLQGLLLASDACWTSPHWRRGFRSFMPKASPATPQGHTTLGSGISSGSARPPV